MTQEKVVALYSGGLDSTSMLFHLRDTGYDVIALGVNYNQRHKKELDRARLICDKHGFPFHVVDFSSLGKLLTGSSQTDASVEVPEGHYAADNMAITVVANRNMMLLSAATAIAISNKAQYVAYAAHKGDHQQYPDCRREFIDALSGAIALCDDSPPTLIAPYQRMTKAEIVTDGISHGAPLGLSWSCYRGEGEHCGRCGTDVERAEAFSLAGVIDPTVYEDPDYWRTVCGAEK